MFAVSGIMQAILLVMCLFWKVRQRKLGIDDFGQPINPVGAHMSDNGSAETVVDEDAVERVVEVGSGEVVGEERTPLLGKKGQSGTERRYGGASVGN